MAAFRPTLRLRLGGVAASILIRETGDFEVEPPSFASDPTVDLVGVPGGEAVAGDLVVVSDGISRLAAALVGTRQSPAAAAANRSLRRLLAREVAVDTIFFVSLPPVRNSFLVFVSGPGLATTNQNTRLIQSLANLALA